MRPAPPASDAIQGDETAGCNSKMLDRLHSIYNPRALDQCVAVFM